MITPTHIYCFVVLLAASTALSAAADETTPKTLTLTRTESVDGRPTAKSNWYISFPHKMRQVEFDGAVTIITDHKKGQVLVLDRAKKTATRTKTVVSNKTNAIDLYAQLFPTDKIARVQPKDMLVEGRTAMAYENTQATWTQTIWIDKESKRPVRMALTTKPGALILNDNFKYDEELAPTLFDVNAVPDGYTLVDNWNATPDSLEWQLK